MARVRARSGVILEAMPLAARGNPNCRRCCDYQERMDSAIRRLNEGDDWGALSLTDEAEQEAEGHICMKLANPNGMNPRRGKWLSVSVWRPIYDPILPSREYRLPLARADVLFYPESPLSERFRVVETPASTPAQDQHEGRVAQHYLGRLHSDEIDMLLSDLTEEDRVIDLRDIDLQGAA